MSPSRGDGWRCLRSGCNDLAVIRRRPGPASLRLAIVAGAIGVIGAWGAANAGAAVPTTLRHTTPTSTTTLPPTTTVPVATTAAPVTTVPQASTDTTPTAQKSGTVAADPAQKRLRWIIGGLVGLAVIILLVTIWFWRATRPSRSVTVTEVQGEEPFEADGPAPQRPSVPTPAAAVAVMAPTAPLPSASVGPPVASVAPAIVPTPAPTSPPPLAPADLYGTPAAPPEPPSAADPDPHWFEEPEPPEFEEPEPPRFEEPDPPKFEAPNGVATTVPSVDEGDDEPWEPRREPERLADDGEQWRGIRPLGPMPQSE